jgi:hypothetical protein
MTPDPAPCERCGQVHLTRYGKPACPGHITGGSRRSTRPAGSPCSHELGWGTDHQGIGQCVAHGGNTESAEKHAEAVLEERRIEEIAKLAKTFSSPVGDMSPEDSLIWQHRELRRQVAWVTSYVADLEADELFYGKAREEAGHEEGHGTGQREGDTTRSHATVVREMRVHAALVVLGRWQHELHMLSVDILRLGLAERLVRLDEQQGLLIIEVIRAILADPDLGVTATAEMQATVAQRHLELVRPVA